MRCQDHAVHRGGFDDHCRRTAQREKSPGGPARTDPPGGARVEPDADIILYGSRARGDAHPESDWDLLILVDGRVDRTRKIAIRHRLYEVEWDSDEVLTSIILSRDDWNTPLYQAMPFHQNVDRDGIPL